MKKLTFKTSLTVLIALVVLLLSSPAIIETPIEQISQKVERYFQIKQSEQNQIEVIETKNKTYLNVPFICQAPLETEANWVLHEESCEEAALLQAYLYETNQTITKQEANQIILDMINWEKQHFGSHKDLYADQMKEFIHGYYNIPQEKIKIIYDADLEDIRQALSQDHPVIVPITGEILKNPYYPYPGYHMLTVIGYTEDMIITNDNGTRRGAGFSYNNKTFLEAMEDAGGDIIILEL